MTFDHNKYDVEQFTYDLNILGKETEMSNKWVLEHFKEAFPPKIVAQLLEIDEPDSEIGKASVMLLAFKKDNTTTGSL